MTRAGPLAGVGVLVTRPAAQAEALSARLRGLGAEVVAFPALAILPTVRPDALRNTLAGLGAYDLAIFISPRAAEYGLAALAELAPNRPEHELAGPGTRTIAWPSRTRIAAVGEGTAKALAGLGVGPVLVPPGGADSEHLLALPELARVEGRRILIFRGEGGRELLAEALRARGAEVDYAECYRRGRPEGADPGPLLEALAAGRLRAVTAFSGETLDNLMSLLGEDAPRLFTIPLFAPHSRVAAHAARLGFVAATATPPGEAGLIDGLVEYFSRDHSA